jgi:orotidine-5'-phosphate decarboxylase
MPLLLPGIGAQGGSLEDIIGIFKESKKFDFLLNVSRGIIYKSKEKDFALAAETEIEKLNASIKALLK